MLMIIKIKSALNIAYATMLPKWSHSAYVNR